MQTAEGGKENSRNEGQGDSKEHRQELVNHVFADFKERMAADPHFVKGVRRHRLCDHILEAHLEMRVEPMGIPVEARVRKLLGVGVVDAAMAAVGFVVQEELHVRLLGLQPHRGARCAAAAAGLARRGSGFARPPLPVARGPAPPCLASPRAARAEAASRCRLLLTAPTREIGRAHV